MARSEKRRAWISLALFFVGLAAILPFATGASRKDWVLPAAFVGLFVSIMALIFFLMFLNRARVEARDFTDSELLAHWKLADGDLEVYAKGMIYDGELYLWDSLECNLEGVGFDPSAPGTLVFLYRLRAGRRAAARRHSIEVPVPPGDEARAEKIIAALRKPLPRDYLLELQGLTEADTWEDGEENGDDNQPATRAAKRK